MTDKKRFKKILLLFLWALYVFYLLYLTLLGRWGFLHNLALFFEGGLDYTALRTNFIPFKTINAFLRYASQGAINVNVWGNVLAFSPFAFFAPLFCPRLRGFFRFFLFLSACILSIELLQGLFLIGSVDVDDYILNMAGALFLFLLLWKTPLKRLLPKLLS